MKCENENEMKMKISENVKILSLTSNGVKILTVNFHFRFLADFSFSTLHR